MFLDGAEQTEAELKRSVNGEQHQHQIDGQEQTVLLLPGERGSGGVDKLGQLLKQNRGHGTPEGLLKLVRSL